MNSKLLLGIGAVVAVGLLIVGGLTLSNPLAEEPAPNGGGTNTEEKDLTTYNSAELGLSFDHPASYRLESHEDGTGERLWTTLDLVELRVLDEYEQNGAMEGPPAITVQVFDNTEGLELEEWIKTTSYSNFKLAPDDTLLSGEVAGEPALAYMHSGLYENNAVAVAHEGKIYLFTVGWLTPEDRNLDVFGDLLDSVRFN